MGAIAPQRRISKTRKRQRRSHFKLEMPGMMVCPNLCNRWYYCVTVIVVALLLIKYKVLYSKIYIRR